MSAVVASIAAAVLSCTGTQSSALLWQEEAVVFELALASKDFAVTGDPSLLLSNLEDTRVSSTESGASFLTADVNKLPNASFSALLANEGKGRSLTWKIVEATAKDGGSTLQAEGKATCAVKDEANPQ